jgi:hypothetical protein
VLFVPERRRSRRAARRDPRGASAASGAIKLGSRHALCWQRAEQSTEPWANVGPRIASESGEMIGVMRTAR